MLARTKPGAVGSTDYRRVFWTLPMPMALVSTGEPAPRILGVTDRLAGQLGAHPVDLEGRELGQVFPRRSAERLAHAVAAAVQA